MAAKPKNSPPTRGPIIITEPSAEPGSTVTVGVDQELRKARVVVDPPVPPEKIPESPQPDTGSPTREPRIPESPENNPPQPLPEKVEQSAPVASRPASWNKPIVVVVALIRHGNNVLIQQRRPDQWMAGKWEFPGGKVDGSESFLNALRRELKEELGVDCDAKLVHEEGYTYPGCFPCKLLYFKVQRLFGIPMGMEGQVIKSVPVADLHSYDMMDADRRVLGMLSRGEI